MYYLNQRCCIINWLLHASANWVITGSGNGWVPFRCQTSAKPLLEPTLICFQLDPKEQTSGKFLIKIQSFSVKKNAFENPSSSLKRDFFVIGSSRKYIDTGIEFGLFHIFQLWLRDYFLYKWDIAWHWGLRPELIDRYLKCIFLKENTRIWCKFHYLTISQPYWFR